MWLSVFGNCEAALEIFVGVRGRTAAELHLHVLGIDVKSRLTERAIFYLQRSCQVYGSFFSVFVFVCVCVSVSSFVSSSFIVFSDYIREM